MVTAYDQPALGAVYKLAALKEGDNWKYKIKLSEQAIKVNNPGIQQVRRFFNQKNGKRQLVADMLYDTLQPLGEKHKIIDPLDITRRKVIHSNEANYEELLISVFQKGEAVYESPEIESIRKTTLDSLTELPSGVKRFINPHSYPVGLEEKLFATKTDLILKLRNLA